MSNLEIIDNKLQAIIETIQDERDDIYILSLDDEYDDPYIERLSDNPLDVMSYLLNNDEIFFVRKVKI